MGIGGKFLSMLKNMYSGDSVDCVVNGVTTRPVYLRRGLRQGCSLSPMLFNLYIAEMGNDICTVDEGFLLGESLRVNILLFADDIILVADTAEGLKRLLSLVNLHCQRLKLVISVEKSQVISPTTDVWELFDESGQLISLKQVLEYKYLGLETFSTMFKIASAKQKKCINVAKKYMFACLHLGRSASNVVRVAMATWESIAVPTILYGCETVPFCETKLAELETIESQVAKRILGVYKNTHNVCAQSELGIKPIRMVIFLRQLKFYFRVLQLPASRWVKIALLDHLSGNWHSPYLDYICKLRKSISLHNEPPTTLYLEVHLRQWALARCNDFILEHSLPCIQPLTSFKMKQYVRSHKQLGILASFRLSNAGLGNKCPVAGLQRFLSCPWCPTTFANTEEHLLFVCSSHQRVRQQTGLALFRTQCSLKDISVSRTHFLFVTGRDVSGKEIDLKDYQARGEILSAMRTSFLAIGEH